MKALEEFSKISPALKAIVAAGVLGAAVYGAVTHNWNEFIVCAPAAIAFVPGYFTMLPRGGMRHGTRCGCQRFDAACELGFWSELSQRVALALPIILASIFLGSILEYDLQRAVAETIMAILTAAMYSMVCGIGLYVMVSKYGD